MSVIHEETHAKLLSMNLLSLALKQNPGMDLKLNNVAAFEIPAERLKRTAKEMVI